LEFWKFFLIFILHSGSLQLLIRILYETLLSVEKCSFVQFHLSPLPAPFLVPRFQCSLKKKTSKRKKKLLSFIETNGKFFFLISKPTKKNAGLESMAAVRNRSINTTTRRRKKNTKKNY